jgi:hypothetical protein
VRTTKDDGNVSSEQPNTIDRNFAGGDDFLELRCWQFRCGRGSDGNDDILGYHG